MIAEVDIPRVKGALGLLSDISPAAQLLQLKNMCDNNDGTWGIPPNAKSYQPALYEMSLFGVPAIATDPDELPANWRRAVTNILEALALEAQGLNCPHWPECACPGGTMRPECPAQAKLCERQV